MNSVAVVGVDVSRQIHQVGILKLTGDRPWRDAARPHLSGQFPTLPSRLEDVFRHRPYPSHPFEDLPSPEVFVQ